MDVQKTHKEISNKLVGKPELIKSGKEAIASLTTTRDMRADEKGLVHGGFVFGLADYAAMIAVNEPFVVLGSANVRFIKPVSFGDRLKAVAEVKDVQKNSSRNPKFIVFCRVFNQKEECVFEGEFICFALKKHVLSET
ncbi:MAG: hotdog domain-containing protein [Candidatus Aenigmatarchaeota archaeon]